MHHSHDLNPTPHPWDEARQLSGAQLAAALRDSRQRTLALVHDLTPAQWNPPRQLGINPIAWELGHIAWFAEFWILRGPHQRDAAGFAQAQQPPGFVGPDTLFDSAQISHAQRWVQTMPTRAQLGPMMAGQLEACIAKCFATAPDDVAACDAALYFHRLALFHEDMHAEAFCWMRSALGYPAPAGVLPPQVRASLPLTLPGAQIRLGYDKTQPGFAFDNESPSQNLVLHGFEIDSASISAGQFARFVEAGGYEAAQYWPGQAGAWRAESACTQPRDWRRSKDGAWQVRWFDQWLPLDPTAAAIHLNAFEAEAYCLWAGRRLPTAAEWEYAATSQAGFEWGHSVWEWTADDFAAYPGFEAGPYREYSQPWFSNHRELRGGAFATHQRMHNPRYRNFFQPHRNDVFAGFRTVARHE